MSVSTMKKLTVFAFREDADRILRKLMNLRCVEAQNMDRDMKRFSLRRLQGDERLSEADSKLAQIRPAIQLLNRYTTRNKGLARIVHHADWEAFVQDGRAEAAQRVAEEANKTAEEIRELHAEESRLADLETSLQPWLNYTSPLNEATKTTITLLGNVPAGSDFEALAKTLAEAGAYAEQVSFTQTGIYLSVTFHKSSETNIKRRLAEKDFVQAIFEGVQQTAAEYLEKVNDDQEKVDIALTEAEEKLRSLSESLGDIEILCDIEETNRRAALLRQRLAQTDACTILSGWFPVFTKDAITELLDKFECAYEINDPEPGQEPPVLLRNNKFAMNFEWVVGMYAYPKYGRFDPTFIMSIFYFLIFGLMFADVGYGLLLTLGCFLGVKLMNPKQGMRRMLYMFGYCGISAIIMGLIFGGWFGDLPTAVMQNILHIENPDAGAGHFFGNGLWFNPLNDPMTFLILSLGMGVLHIVTGMALQFFILCKDGKTGEALCTIAPYWVLFAGLGLFLVDGLIAKVVSLVGVVLILLLKGYGIRNPLKRIFKGLGGLYGLVSYASDLLSYSRILALGLVAGVIAKVINLITMMGNSFVGFIVMLIVLVAGHLLNLAINVLGSFVHTSRLQYLEFFGKFYEDGGRPFDPACPANEYSEQIENVKQLN